MAKMTLLWLALYWGGIAAAFVNPVYGLMAYLFEYYLRPSLHWWGTALPVWRYSFIVSIAALSAFAVRRSSMPPVPSIRNPALPWLVGLVGLMVVFTPITAVDIGTSWNVTIAFAKLLSLYGLIIGVLRTQWAFDAFAAVHIAGAGWWGWEAWLDPHRAAGRLMNVGSGDTQGDNEASAHLLTVLPFLAVYLLCSKNRKLQILSLVAAPFILNTFILCNSRGATLGFGAAVLAAVVLVHRGHRKYILAASLATVLAVFSLADREFIERQQTTKNYDVEGAERLESWRGAIRLFTDHPLGVGGGGFKYLSPVYIRRIVEEHDGERRAVHNTYLLILTEWGVPGIVLFAGFIGMTFVLLHRVRRLSLDDGEFYYRSIAVQTGLIGTLVAATFSDRFAGESTYWLCALAFALCRIQQQALVGSDVPEPAQSVMHAQRPITVGARQGVSV